MDLSPDEEHFQGRLLHQAALWDNLELLTELLSTGAEVESRDSRGRTALHAAALAERSRCLEALCARGAGVDAREDEATGGKTALHVAAERGHVENIRTLLKAGASLEALDAGGACALALAERHGHRHAARALREATVLKFTSKTKATRCQKIIERSTLYLRKIHEAGSDNKRKIKRQVRVDSHTEGSVSL